MDLGLSGKTAIVTGGASNIGRSISLAFAREGANVIIADIDAPQAEKTAIEANNMKPCAIFVKCDVTSLDDVHNMVREGIGKFGRIDILVNNAGWDRPQPFVETTPDFWDKVININYKGVLNCTKAVLSHMTENRGGAIVSISSDAGRVGEYGEAVYSGAKAAINSFTKAVAREVGKHGIRANAVCPGITVPGEENHAGERSMWRQALFSSEQLERIAKTYPLRKVGRGEDVAHAVLFLASDAVAGHITGQILSVSGGYSMMG